MQALGIIILALGIALLLVNQPRAKRKRRQRRNAAIATLLVGVAVLGGPTLQQHVADSGTASKLSSTASSVTTQSASGTTSHQPATKLAALNYNGDQEITIAGNKPGFTKSEMSTTKGPWTRFANLDRQNRAGVAEAMLNKRLMPTAPRERLTWDPTGWHNKKIHGEWLYNRSHLIGFQLSGENNNPKNLMTGTRSLNSPLMQAHEDDIAAYLKADPNHYVRYEVQPIFRGSELLARGVAMRAQSVGDNTIHFNVYIFNVEQGVGLNYADGTSHAE